MKRVAEKTTKIAKTAVENTSPMVKPGMQQKRDYATLSSGYFDKSSVPNTKAHPQVLQKDLHGNIIDNKRVGLTHTAQLKPQHEAQLPKVILKYSIGMDAAQQKEQFCYHFDSHYSVAELAKYREDPLLTKYLNENPRALFHVSQGFALVRGLHHQKEMERILKESDKAFAELEEKLKNKK